MGSRDTKVFGFGASICRERDQYSGFREKLTPADLTVLHCTRWPVSHFERAWRGPCACLAGVLDLGARVHG
jgi:hypothetical protein